MADAFEPNSNADFLERTASHGAGASSTYSESQATPNGVRQRDSDFIDIDPLLKGFKEGAPMQRTYFNTKMGVVASRTLGSDAFARSNGSEVLKTDVGSSYRTLHRVNRLGGAFGLPKLSSPACNYQNVDLFKIPDVNFRKLARRSRSPLHKISQASPSL
jgi:hypothetical protein